MKMDRDMHLVGHLLLTHSVCLKLLGMKMDGDGRKKNLSIFLVETSSGTEKYRIKNRIWRHTKTEQRNIEGKSENYIMVV